MTFPALLRLALVWLLLQAAGSPAIAQEAVGAGAASIDEANLATAETNATGAPPGKPTFPDATKAPGFAPAVTPRTESSAGDAVVLQQGLFEMDHSAARKDVAGDCPPLRLSHVETTDTVEATMLNRFGYTFRAPPGRVEVRIVHPPFTGAEAADRHGVAQWEAAICADRPAFAGWAFTKAEELVPGEWRVEVARAGETLLSRTFQVVEAEAIPALQLGYSLATRDAVALREEALPAEAVRALLEALGAPAGVEKTLQPNAEAAHAARTACRRRGLSAETTVQTSPSGDVHVTRCVDYAQSWTQTPADAGPPPDQPDAALDVIDTPDQTPPAQAETAKPTASATPTSSATWGVLYAVFERPKDARRYANRLTGVLRAALTGDRTAPHDKKTDSGAPAETVSTETVTAAAHDDGSTGEVASPAGQPESSPSTAAGTATEATAGAADGAITEANDGTTAAAHDGLYPPREGGADTTATANASATASATGHATGHATDSGAPSALAVPTSDPAAGDGLGLLAPHVRQFTYEGIPFLGVFSGAFPSAAAAREALATVASPGMLDAADALVTPLEPFKRLALAGMEANAAAQALLNARVEGLSDSLGAEALAELKPMQRPGAASGERGLAQGQQDETENEAAEGEEDVASRMTDAATQTPSVLDELLSPAPPSPVERWKDSPRVAAPARSGVHLVVDVETGPRAAERQAQRLAANLSEAGVNATLAVRKLPEGAWAVRVEHLQDARTAQALGERVDAALGVAEGAEGSAMVVKAHDASGAREASERGMRYTVQAAATRVRAEAERYAASLEEHGLEARVEEEEGPFGGSFAVRVGRHETLRGAWEAALAIKRDLGLAALVVAEWSAGDAAARKR